MEAAKWLLAEEFCIADGVELLRWWRDEFWTWRGTHYLKVDKSEFKARILRWLDDNGVGAKPRLAQDIVECIAALCVVSSHVDQPVILVSEENRKPEFKAENIIAFRNGLLNIVRGGVKF